MKVLLVALLALPCITQFLRAQGTQPIVAIHDSELTRALDSDSAPAVPPTPTGPGTTGRQWWPTNWHYFVMPESVKEALRSDGTAFTTLGDSNVTAGLLLPNGLPKYPIVISLATEAVRNDEIAPLTNYVAAGGFLLVGSSAFTRNPDGSPRGDFAFANEMGVHTAQPGLLNWGPNTTFTKQIEHRLVSHLPLGYVNWGMPSGAEDTPWGISPAHLLPPGHPIWQTQPADATILANGDTFPNNYLYLTVKPYGKGYFIYYAPMQPLLGQSGFSPGMYAYLILRKAVEWAFESAKLPVVKVSPWPYPYDAAFMARHDLEDYAAEISGVESSAQAENAVGAKGSYYFCTGTLRQDMGSSSNAAIAGLRSAVSNYHATIGPHNGGLPNPNNPALSELDYDFWHWGPDEALDVTPPGYPSGKAYALASLANSFSDVDGWLSGLTNGMRAWVAPYFNATREDSFDIQEQLSVKATGEEKISIFPCWVFSTKTPGKRYSFISEPVSDWYIGHDIAQVMDNHTTNTLHDLIDFYYGLGGLINVYTHLLSDTGLPRDYITYGMNPALHPRTWPVNATDVYQWWQQRSNAHVSASFSTNGTQFITVLSITGATDPNTAVELAVPGAAAVMGLQVLTNNVLAGGDSYRLNGQVIKLRVGTSVTSARIQYVLGPRAQNDSYTAVAGRTLTVLAPGVLANDSAGAGSTLTAQLVSAPINGTLSLDPSGAFTYTAPTNFMGTETFTYQVTDGINISSPATVTIVVRSGDYLFYDDFTRATDPGPLAPWVAQQGNWTITGGVLHGGPDAIHTYGFAYTMSWTNYAAEARIQFPAGSFGGGLSGRLNPATGAHYALWLYPGSSTLELIKFQDWSTFGYNGSPSAPMAVMNLPAVGQAWHTLKLAFQGNQIGAYYDGALVMSVTDIEPQPYLSGGIGADMWTDSSTYVVSMDDVLVTPLAVGDAYSMNQDATLTVAAPGVLGNDSVVFGSGLTASLVSGPANGLLSLNSDGSFIYTPGSGFTGSDSFTYQAMNGAVSLGTTTVSITVKSTAVAGPPVIVAPSPASPWLLGCSAATLTAAVIDGNSTPLAVVWSVNNAAVQTNLIPAGHPVTNIMSFSPGISGGQFNLQIAAFDGLFPPAIYTNTVVIKDTIPPVVACAANVILANGLLNICSYDQKTWDKAPHGNNPGSVLFNNFAAVYKNGFVEVGIPGSNGFSMRFTSAKAVQAYVPSSGTAAALTADAVNPTASASGVLGGEILALQLNVDFNDAGAFPTGGGDMGDLIFEDPASALNGLTVRQLLALANSALGGTDISASGITLAALNDLLDNLNNAFMDCKVSSWALAHLLPSGANLPAPGSVTATDNCDPNPVLTYSDSASQGSCAGGYTLFRTWKAVDAAGNVGTCVQILSQVSSSGSICGTIFRDCNGDGGNSGDTGLAGIGITLKDGLGTILGTTVTDSKGAYCFNGLSANSYVVSVQPPPNYVQSADPDSNKDNQTTVLLGSCQTRSGVNFGYAGTVPALKFSKRGPATAAVGSTITYTFSATNTGNTCFYLQGSDPMLGGVIFSQLSVAPGQSVSFNKAYTVKPGDVGSLVNLATATATPPIGSPVSAQSSWTVIVFAVPTGLATTPGDTMVGLSWNPVANANSYNVKRSTVSGGPYTTIQTGVTGTNFTDVNVTNGIVYYYVVSDVTGNGESPNSSQIGAIPAAPLPSPWNTQDIGNVAATGGANYNTNTGGFTVIGSGTGLTDGADEFRYVYQLASGDCSVVARVFSVQNTDPAAKAGVMIRETLNANAAHASTIISPSKTASFVYRSSTGGSTGTSSSSSYTAPYWVKITRGTNTFTSYISANGTTWKSLGSKSITMGANVYIGLAVSSRNDGVLCTGVIDNVTATP